ncbi:hypothetical protein [Streptomyces sp. NBC_00203]|uniref:hypothetical protein n=1 Tax=Streptomyces sp. NBC_00203 TaxID=2975680 RepID=UPI0032518B6D
MGEVAYQGGQDGHLGAGGGELITQDVLVLAQVVGMGEQEADGAARGEGGVLGLDPAPVPHQAMFALSTGGTACAYPLCVDDVKRFDQENVEFTVG